MVCRITHNYYGKTKAEAVKCMIQDKLIAEERKNIKQLIKKAKIEKDIKEMKKQYRLYKNHQKLYNEADKEKNNIKKIIESKISQNEPKLQITWDGDIKLNHSYCFVPDKVLDELERYDCLMALGKRKEADKIFDKLVKDWKLEE